MTTHQVINADCYEAIKDIPDNSIDLVIMDPPYDLDIHPHRLGCFEYSTGTKKNFEKLQNFSKGFNLSIFDELKRVCNPYNLYCFCSTKQVNTILNIHNGYYNDILTWIKNNPPPFRRSAYLPNIEYIIFVKQAGTYWNCTSNELGRKDYISSNSYKPKYPHPTIKPTELIERFILNSSKEGDTILDPFAGSGTTAECAKRLGRNSISIEIERKYCDIIERRIEPDIKIKTLPLFQDQED